MKLLFLGDVFGKPGRDVIEENLDRVVKEHNIDYVIINAENAAHGRGITVDIAKSFFDIGAHCLTLGNHSWDQREIIPYIEKEERLVRPANYPEGTIGKGYFLDTSQLGLRILTINMMGRLFMDPLDCPFQSIDDILVKFELGRNVDIIFVDMHTETTSEKAALAHYCDGRITALVGSHTHIPTADAMILKGGTGFQTDAGMCGNYHSVVGAIPETAIARFRKEINAPRLAPDVSNEGTMCGVVIETNPKTGLTTDIYPVREKGVLRTLTSAA
ncbi:MAG: metallophosphoesterase [Rickettsiales bacterium]|nr:metallophosphoesterase [Rickettsiales bacterium]|tara:strand:+ start:540 stop:1358 length:819 start_codon:yes stop_codon:yes gene_type:complete